VGGWGVGQCVEALPQAGGCGERELIIQDPLTRSEDCAYAKGVLQITLRKHKGHRRCRIEWLIVIVQVYMLRCLVKKVVIW
jgi:hypothetical protein